VASTHRVEGEVALDLDAHAAAPQRLVLQVHQASIAFMGPGCYVSSTDAVKEHMLTDNACLPEVGRCINERAIVQYPPEVYAVSLPSRPGV